jgi:hypothetical protein
MRIRTTRRTVLRGVAVLGSAVAAGPVFSGQKAAGGLEALLKGDGLEAGAIRGGGGRLPLRGTQWVVEGRDINAVRAASNSARSGDTVYFRNGVYTIDGEIRVKSGVLYYSATVGGVTVNWVALRGSLFSDGGSILIDTAIDGFHITATRSRQDTMSFVNISSSGIDIRNNEIRESRGHAIRIAGTGNLLFHNLFSTHSNSDQVVGSGDRFRFMHNTIMGGVGSGLRFGRGSACCFLGNKISQIGSSDAGRGMSIDGALANSVIRDNDISNCWSFGMHLGGAGNFNDVIIYNNTTNDIGHVAGQRVNDSGTGVEMYSDSSHCLFLNHHAIGCEGYSIAINGSNVLASQNGANNNWISDCTLGGPSDPTVLFNGTINSTLRRCKISSLGSVGCNIGDEHDEPADRISVSTGARITNNTFADCAFECIMLTGCSGAYVMGNVAAGPSVMTFDYHYQAILTLSHWSKLNGGTQNATIVCNKFYSSANGHRYGIYIDVGQGGETVKWNVLYPNQGAAVEDHSGVGTNTIVSNQTTNDTAPTQSAPPVANAGPSRIVYPGTVVALDGSDTSQLSGSATDITYSWTQIVGPKIPITHLGAAQASIIVPYTDTVMILGFRLTASDQNGFTTDDAFLGIDPISGAPT